jgi:hypothetical protein
MQSIFMGGERTKKGEERSSRTKLDQPGRFVQTGSINQFVAPAPASFV